VPPTQPARRLLEELGGEYREVTGSDVGAALVDFARAENATQIVLGASRRSRWQELTPGSVINRVIRRSGPIDVHVISADADHDGAMSERPQCSRVLGSASLSGPVRSTESGET
jgi:two-component system sensor histidine kinase KdpD